jgi:tetratricopeptide (TPR) repeat protein
MARTARPGAASALLLAALLLPARAAAQEPVERALELEQRGEAVQAAAQYAAALRQHPQDVVALLGLERTAAQAGWRDTVLVYAARALAADSTEVTAYAVALRTLRSEGRDSAAAEVLRRWSAAQPRRRPPGGGRRRRRPGGPRSRRSRSTPTRPSAACSRRRPRCGRAC